MAAPHRLFIGEVVAAQLTARTLPIPEDPDSNPNIGNFYSTYFQSTVSKKTKIKKKTHFFKKARLFLHSCPTNVMRVSSYG